MGILSNNDGFLGVDIGSTSIKIVELKKIKGEVKLLTYGYSENVDLQEITNKKSLSDSIKMTAEVIKKICAKAEVSSHSAVSALPAFSVFSSVINLPILKPDELATAINFEAKKIIPLPINEMTLSWVDIGQGERSNTKNYLLTGAPKSLINKYTGIFKEARINLLNLETEIFSLVRSLLGNDKTTVMIVEIGANTTDISIVSESIPIMTRSIDIGGSTITKAISNNLKIGVERAEQFKYDMGISNFETQESIIPKTVVDTINPIINEIKYLLNIYQNKNGKNVEKIILSGGSSMLINFPSYLSKLLNMQVVVSNPWSRISYPLDLKPILDEIGPKMSIAVGLAMRQIN